MHVTTCPLYLIFGHRNAVLRNYPYLLREIELVTSFIWKLVCSSEKKEGRQCGL